jgi:hypothetical protein
MESDFYKELARFRIITVNSVKSRSKRSLELIYRSFDEELTRIANSIQNGYTLGAQRITAMGELYRPYKYLDITITAINHPELSVVQQDPHWKCIYKATHPPEIYVEISRGSHSVKVTDENINKLLAWCKSWRIRKPETLEECNDESFYQRWW